MRCFPEQPWSPSAPSAPSSLRGCCSRGARRQIGRPPFHGGTEYLTFEAVLAGDLQLSAAALPEESADLVERLLTVDPARRLGGAGGAGASALREHPFFAGTQWRDKTRRAPPAHSGWLRACQ